MPFNVGLPELIVMLVMMLAFAGVFVLVIRALATPGRRVCPVCGSPVKRGLTTCATCQHDFAAAQQS
jgi:predicted amidophosphoribosyltransferase